MLVGRNSRRQGDASIDSTIAAGEFSYANAFLTLSPSSRLRGGTQSRDSADALHPKWIPHPVNTVLVGLREATTALSHVWGTKQLITRSVSLGGLVRRSNGNFELSVAYFHRASELHLILGPKRAAEELHLLRVNQPRTPYPTPAALPRFLLEVRPRCLALLARPQLRKHKDMVVRS